VITFIPTIEDLPSLKPLVDEFVEKVALEYTSEWLLNQVAEADSKGSLVLVCAPSTESDLVGFALILFHDDSLGRKTAFIHSMFIRQGHINHNCGRHLMNTLVKICNARLVHHITAVVAPNSKLKGIYGKYGFRPNGVVVRRDL